MSKIRDSQKSSVYAWENTIVAPHDQNLVHFDSIQSVINWIWQQEGLQYPPLIEKMPKQKHASGDASRICLRFQEQTYTWIILHELAHAMTSNIDDLSNHHGSLFMGIYIQLLIRYLHLPYQEIVDSALSRGLKIKLDARPVFI